MLLYEKLVIDLNINDEILHGKFKNKTSIVKKITKDEYGLPIVIDQNNKEIHLMKVRIKKFIKK